MTFSLSFLVILILFAGQSCHGITFSSYVRLVVSGDDCFDGDDDDAATEADDGAMVDVLYFCSSAMDGVVRMVGLLRLVGIGN